MSNVGLSFGGVGASVGLSVRLNRSAAVKLVKPCKRVSELEKRVRVFATLRKCCRSREESPRNHHDTKQAR